MMWNLLMRIRPECKSTRDALESAALQNPSARSAQEWIEKLPAAAREHVAACSQCLEAAENLAATRVLFRSAAGAAEAASPFFASRVMAAIAAKERALAELLNPWSEVPRFATKLAWISAVLLLAGTTWIYERQAKQPARSSGGDASQESIFEPPPPANQDDVLISMVEAPR